MKQGWILTFAFISMSAFAQQPKDRVQLDDLDTDKDGAISRAEAQKGPPVLVARFDAFDANKDGLLTREELRVGAQAKTQGKQLTWFSDADTNIDGKLTREEVTGTMPALERAFATIDVNGDGYLSREEALAYGKSQIEADKARKP
jgi:hypothetical protein